MKTRKIITSLVAFFAFATAIAQNLPSYVPGDGLVGYWGFDGNANEVIGHTNNGAVNGALLTTDINGITNSAYVFDGVSNYIDLPFNFYGGQTATVVSFSLRFKVSSNGDYYIWNKDGSWLEAGIYTTLNGAFGIFWAYPNQYNGIVTSNGSVVPNTWYDAVIIINGSNSKIYLNGNEQTGVTVSNPSNSIGFSDAGTCGSGINRFGFKKTSCSPANYFNGILDEFMLYDRTLTQAEITQLYTGTGNGSPLATAQNFCGAAKVASLKAVGTDLKWYDSETATTPLALTAKLITQTYYVSQTIAGTESLKRRLPLPQALPPQLLW